MTTTLSLACFELGPLVFVDPELAPLSLACFELSISSKNGIPSVLLVLLVLNLCPLP